MPLITSSPFRSPPPAPPEWTIASSTLATNETSTIGSFISVCRSLEFNEDGTKMYATEIDDFGGEIPAVHQWTLSTPWNLSTASHDGEYQTSSPVISPASVTFRTDDGTRMYVAGFSGATIAVRQYALTTPFDVTGTVTHQGVFNFGVGGFGTGIEFKPDGTKLYFCYSDGAASFVREYGMTSAWDITAGLTLNYTYTAPDIPTSIQDITISPSGTKIQMADFGSGDMYEDVIATPWDLSTAQGATGRIIRPNGVMIPPAFNTPIGSVSWKNDDGTKMYLLDGGVYDVYESNTP